MDLSNENIVHIVKDEIEFLKFRKLDEHEEILHAFSLKPLNFRNRPGIEKNYKTLFNVLDIPYSSLVKITQSHTDNIIKIDCKENSDSADINLDYLQDVDGSITDKSNIALATTSADCLCVILYDTKNKVVSNIHSGWRGTFKKIVLKAVKKMTNEYGSNPKDIEAYLMPAIRKCHFEVDLDVMELCKNIFEYTGKIDKIISKGRNIEGVQKYNIDNILINKLLLEEAGVLEENIFDSGICSVCNSEKVHSRRSDGENFGLGTTIVMKK